MRDLFDDFLEELRRREAPGPRRDATRSRRRSKRLRRRRGRGERWRVRPGPRPRAPSASTGPDRPATTDERPPAAAARRPGRRPRRRRGRGGASASASGSPSSCAIIVLFSFGLDLWTDALWYASVGFDGVFWTRLGAQVGLFAAGLVLALVVLLGNLWLATRLSPPPDRGRPAAFRGLFDRLNEAAQAGATGRARPGGRWSRGAARSRSPSRPTTSRT